MNEAAFAQPSGIAVDGNTLYVADAECNAIRAVQLPPMNTVTTLAGGDLFEFGDRTAGAMRVRLQHPLGVAANDGRVFIADTYNHKIKLLDPATGKVSTFATGFHEPGGLSIAGNTLYVADTNNHADSHGRSLVAKGRHAHDRRFDPARHLELPSPPMTARLARLRAARRPVCRRAVAAQTPAPSWCR